MRNPILLFQTGRELTGPYSYQGVPGVAVNMGITEAQLNAGFNIINPGHNLQIRPLGFFIRINTDAVGEVTDIRLGSTASTPVVIATILQAVLVAGSRHTHINGVAANGTTPSLVALGAGFGVALAKGVGVKLYKTGSDAATGAPTIDVIFWYDLI
jgi:hypothetical protein